MNRVAMTAVVAILLITIACGPPPSKNYVATGTVRSVWCHLGQMVEYCDVTFEHDSGELQTLAFYSPVPLWNGLHARLYYHGTPGNLCGLDRVER